MADQNKKINYTPWQSIVKAAGFTPDTKAGGTTDYTDPEDKRWHDPEVQKRMEAMKRGAGFR